MLIPFFIFSCTTDGLNALKTEFNFLNLTDRVKDLSGTTKAVYTWLANGVKAGVKDAAGTNGYEYLGSLVYQRVNGQLQLESAAFGGGRILAAQGSNRIVYTPNYFLTDHLGSVRTIINGVNGQVVEQNDYYAFGAKHVRSDYMQTTNRFKYNGKELQTTGSLAFLDYGARMYDPATGRWFNVDPLTEKYYSISPYAYCLNNPLKFVDIDGKQPGIRFISPIAAAKNWGEYYNGKSILIGREMASTIYIVTEKGNTRYVYTEAAIGGNDGVAPRKAPTNTTREATIHSHGKFEKGYLNNDFSPADKKNAHTRNADNYVTTPKESDIQRALDENYFADTKK